MTYLSCQCGCGGLPAWGRCQLVGHLQQVRNVFMLFFIILSFDTYNKWESKNVIFHLTPTASENARKLLVILLLVTCGRYGYGAENILSMRVVLADGRIAEVTAEKTEVEIFFRLENDFFWDGNTLVQILSPTPSTVVHTESNNLFFALRGAGSSYGVVTQFKYNNPDMVCMLFPTNWKMRNTTQVHCARGSRGKASHPPRLGGQLGRPCRNQGCWTGHRTTW